MKHTYTILILIILVGLWASGHAQSANLPGPATGGNQDCVQVSTVPITNTFTVEAWIYPTQLTGGHADYAIYGFSVMASSGVVGAYPLWITVYGTEVRVWTFEATAGSYKVTTGAGLTTNNWHHIAVTCTKGGNTTVYVNGVSKLSYTNDGETNWSTSFTIGALRPTRPATNLAFVGLIDEVRVWDDIRTIGEITTNMFNELDTTNPLAMQGIAGYWTFNGNANDTSGNNLVTVLTNGAQANGAQNPLVGPPITLPVELSSFSAILTADFFVKLHWTTQSETGVSGFYIYRSLTNDIADAISVSPLLEPTNTTTQHNYDYTDTELIDPGTYYYWLSVQNLDGSVNYHGPTTVYYDHTSNQGAPGIPIISGLASIYPNPFNPSTTISYGLNKASNVSFEIYNARGQIVRNISEGQKAAGNWKLNWNGLDNNGIICSSGVYYIRMSADKDVYIKKALLLK